MENCKNATYCITQWMCGLNGDDCKGKCENYAEVRDKDRVYKLDIPIKYPLIGKDRLFKKDGKWYLERHHTPIMDISPEYMDQDEQYKVTVEVSCDNRR